MTKFENVLTEFDNLDFYIYTNHPDLYDELSEMENQVLEEARLKFVGNEYEHPPLPTLIDLKTALDNRYEIIVRNKALRAPQIIIDEHQRVYDEIYDKIKKQEYIKSHDKKALQYYDDYNALNKKFYKSKKFKEAVENIIKHNKDILRTLGDLGNFDKENADV